MSDIAHVRLHTVYARVAVTQRASRLEIEYTREPFSSLALTEVRIRSTAPMLQIDATETRAALGLFTTRGFRDEVLEQSWEASRAALDGVVAEGHALGGIEDPRSVAQVVAQAYLASPDLRVGLRLLPGPRVSITPGEVGVSVEVVGGVGPLYRYAPRVSWSAPEFHVALAQPGDVLVAVVPGGSAVGLGMDALA